MANHLSDMKTGDIGRVLGYAEGGQAYRKKLLSMGLTRGTEFKVTRYAPMGDPVEIHVRGFSLSLRKQEAEALMIEKV
jgi:ferrous iron transport protein A